MCWVVIEKCTCVQCLLPQIASCVGKHILLDLFLSDIAHGNNSQTMGGKWSWVLGIHSRHWWGPKRCSVLLRILGITCSWQDTQSLQHFQPGDLHLRCQGYLRTKARPGPPATWPCIPFLQQEEPTRASSSPLKGGAKGRGQAGMTLLG